MNNSLLDLALSARQPKPIRSVRSSPQNSPTFKLPADEIAKLRELSKVLGKRASYIRALSRKYDKSRNTILTAMEREPLNG